MINPFLITGDDGSRYADSCCSLNRMIIAEVPVKGIDDSIKGKRVKDIFSLSVISEKALSFADRLRLPKDVSPKEIPSLLMSAAESEDMTVRAAAENIAEFFGKRLALILLTLKTALPENRKIRRDWNSSHWEYWQSIENIVAVGGLTDGNFGKVLIDEARKYCVLNGRQAYNIITHKNAVYMGVMGCSKILRNSEGVNVLADFGQTNIKISIVKRLDGKIIKTENLPKVKSEYMQLDIEDKAELERQAKLLHEYILSCICNACKKAEVFGNAGNEIVISIASYVNSGKLDKNRGGYAKLNVLCDNYEEYLSRSISDVLNKNIKVKLVHDATAVGLYFSDCPKSVCLTLGTFIGVGFTDII